MHHRNAGRDLELYRTQIHDCHLMILGTTPNIKSKCSFYTSYYSAFLNSTTYFEGLFFLCFIYYFNNIITITTTHLVVFGTIDEISVS